jgi:DNA-directed RNA polymerase subunit RPC12/RpoP
MPPIDYHDLPWDDLLAQAQDTINSGATVYQKFTCGSCGARQTIESPNKFYTEGQCEECGHITDLKQKGGGFMAHFSVNE